MKSNNNLYLKKENAQSAFRPISINADIDDTVPELVLDDDDDLLKMMLMSMKIWKGQT